MYYLFQNISILMGDLGRQDPFTERNDPLLMMEQETVGHVREDDILLLSLLEKGQGCFPVLSTHTMLGSGQVFFYKHILRRTICDRCIRCE